MSSPLFSRDTVLLYEGVDLQEFSETVLVLQLLTVLVPNEIRLEEPTRRSYKFKIIPLPENA